MPAFGDDFYYKIRGMIYLLSCVFLGPVKFLEILFVRRKVFIFLAPSILTHVRKPNKKLRIDNKFLFLNSPCRPFIYHIRNKGEETCICGYHQKNERFVG